MRGKSKALKTQQGKDCTMSNHTSGAIQLELPLFATVGLAPQSSEMTSIDKSLICNPSTQTQKSSKISGQDSTSK
ncbi:transposase, partial [Sphaerospermopsis kisseleviana CS-549]|nr:transposase [Sphaerospermopsis kisseleviana CS-549]